MSSKNSPLKMILAGLMLALCMVLPLLTGQIPQIGKALSPMHIPVLLCGFLCDPIYALAVGAVAPLLRFVIFGMPVLFPTGLAMCFELAVYGFAAGLLYRKLPKSVLNVYISLIGAMLIGRVVWGVASAVLFGMAGKPFGMSAFMAGAFVNAVPGIILHIILIPAIVMAAERAFPQIKNQK